MDNSLLDECLTYLKEYDNEWIIRKRKITSEFIFKSLICSALTNIGISSCLEGFQSNVSHSAVIKARRKIDPNLFKTINTHIHSNIINNVYAIDGSKIRIHSGFKKYGFKSRTNDKPVDRAAKRPLAMLSSLYGVESQTTFNYTITKHFNERKCVPKLISVLKKGNIVIMDRGYYSAKLFTHFYQTKIHAVFRLKKDANKTVKKLYKLRWGVETSYKRIKSYHNLNTIYAKTYRLWKQELQLRILYDTLLINVQTKTQIKKRKNIRRIAYGIINLRCFTYILSIPLQFDVNLDFG